MGITRWLIRLLGLCALVYVITFIWILVFTVTFENPQDPPDVDVIVCLGGGAEDDGSLKYSSAVRADTCADLYLRGGADMVLFTGAHANKEISSVAERMAEIAKLRGVPANAILLEEDSRSTLQNALFSADLLKDTRSLLLVTQSFHLQRSKLSFQAIGSWEIHLWMAERFDRNRDGTIRWKAMYREALAVWFNAARFGVWSLAKWMGLRHIDGLLV